MRYYFLLQYRVFKRHVTDSGLPFVVGVLLLLGLGGVCCLFAGKYPRYAPFVLGYMAVNMLYGLSDPDRADFLKNIYDKRRYRTVRFVESLLCVAPFVLISIFQERWLLATALIAVGLASANVSVRRLEIKKIPTPFSGSAFEFVILFRRYWWLLAVLYAVAGIAAYHENTNLLLVSMGIVMLLCLGAYDVIEDGYYVWNASKTPSGFIRSKICTGGLRMGMLVAPFFPFLLFGGISAVLWGVICWFGGLLLLALVVLVKYSVYPRKSGPMEAVGGMLIALVPLLLVAVYPYYYKKSIRNLKNHL